MHGLDRKRYFWVIASAILQGLLLSGYAYTETGPYLMLPLVPTVIVPFALWLGQEPWGRRLWLFLAALAALLLVFHAYWLWAVLPAGSGVYRLPAQKMNLARLSAAVFLFLPFFQCRIATWRWRVPYSDIFFQLCRNVFLLFQAVIVTATFWGLLLTASLLFDIIGLEFVPRFVFSPIVAFPLTSLTIALSITLALKHPGVDSLGRWILAILAWLLPPFSILSTVFVAALPFSGLRTLWSTGQASSLMLLLQFSTILLANAAWLDGTRTPFSNRIANAAARLSLLCLPVYTALCLYSLGLRVQQYGWSVDRIHAAFFVIVAGVWGLGYAGSVLLRQWPSAIGRVNVASALILAVLVAAMNSPVLDPYRLAADNQVDRLLGGQTNPESFDFLYLRFNLGRYGGRAMSRLEEAKDAPNAESIREYAKAALAADAEEHWTDERGVSSEKRRREILAGARISPAGEGNEGGEKVLPRFLEDILASRWDFFFHDVRDSSELAFSLQNFKMEEGGEELLLIRQGTGLVLDVSSKDARVVGEIFGVTLPAGSLDVKTAVPRFRDVEINGQRYQILTPRIEAP
jgi:hypothetical protein